MESFPKGTGFDELFKRLEEVINKKSNQVEETVMKIYNDAHIKPISARGLMHAIVQDHKLDCGCCYKLSEPAVDIIVAELTMLQFMLDEVENILKRENNTKVLEILDHNKRIMQVMLVGIKQMGVSSEALYRATMNVYANNYHLANPGNKKEPFDHIIGMEEAINQIVERKKAKDNK